VTFEYRDPDGDSLIVTNSKTDAGQPVVWMATSPDGVNIDPARVEEVVAGIRDAARTASGQQPKPPAAYSDGKGRIYCQHCAHTVDAADVPLTVDHVDHWELCPNCGRHVVDVARGTSATGKPDPAVVDEFIRDMATRHACGNCDGIDPDTCLTNPDRPTRTALRDRLRRAICEAEGFAWDSDMLEPDEYGDHADAVLQVLDELLPERKDFAALAAGQPDPTTADDPTPLRWGHGDVLHGDDDTVIVCLSGPAPERAPYWLELDRERAAALRDDLTTPDELAAAVGQPAKARTADEAPLTAAERQFLTFALDLADNRMANRSDEFTTEDYQALAAFRRMAEEARS
jgi:hypothetical protein